MFAASSTPVSDFGHGHHVLDRRRCALWAAWSVGNLIGGIREWRYSLRGRVKRAFGVPAAA